MPTKIQHKVFQIETVPEQKERDKQNGNVQTKTKALKKRLQSKQIQTSKQELTDESIQLLNYPVERREKKMKVKVTNKTGK